MIVIFLSPYNFIASFFCSIVSILSHIVTKIIYVVLSSIYKSLYYLSQLTHPDISSCLQWRTQLFRALLLCGSCGCGGTSKMQRRMKGRVAGHRWVAAHCTISRTNAKSRVPQHSAVYGIIRWIQYGSPTAFRNFSISFPSPLHFCLPLSSFHLLLPDLFRLPLYRRSLFIPYFHPLPSPFLVSLRSGPVLHQELIGREICEISMIRRQESKYEKWRTHLDRINSAN